MKKLYLLFLLSISLSANHVNWYSNFEDAHKEALRQHKEMMVFLITGECSTCKDVLVKTFMNNGYIDRINENFISVIVTKDQKQSYPIEMLYTLTYPALFFLNEQELFSCEPLEGVITPQILENHLKKCNFGD